MAPPCSSCSPSTVARRRSGNRGVRAMRRVEKDGPLRIGLLGSGFIASFHLQALLGVRDAQVSRVFSPTRTHRETLANKANGMGLGPCKAYGWEEELAPSDGVAPIGTLAPHPPRLDHMR